LSTYLKRPWTALSPCPLAKELQQTHPRRTYFYLTTVPHQDIPSDSAEPQARRSIISPSLSSADENDEDADERRRSEMSPSPEVDLSAPELDDSMDVEVMGPPTHAGSYSGRNSLARHRSSAMIT